MNKEKKNEDSPVKMSSAMFDTWTMDPSGPVALYLRQKLLPVESIDDELGIIYPPTYATIGYNIDPLSDGKMVALIDSVGSQANRLEPVFAPAPEADRKDWLVPNIEIVIRKEDCGECKVCKKDKAKKGEKCENPRKVKLSMLDLAHRSADSVVLSSPGLKEEAANAFKALNQQGDAGPLCTLAPTSLVFGFWDSRGGSNEKRPRLVRSIIRAWDVEPLHASAQFNSVWKMLDKEKQNELSKEEKAQKTDLSKMGFADAFAVNVLGGVLVKGRIEREVTVNMVALRGLHGSDENETKQIRKYLLCLSLLAATAEIDLFLREGCHLRYAEDDQWYEVPRRGKTRKIVFEKEKTLTLIRKLALEGADHFRPKWPEKLEYDFNLSEAKKLIANKKQRSTPKE